MRLENFRKHCEINNLPRGMRYEKYGWSHEGVNIFLYLDSWAVID